MRSKSRRAPQDIDDYLSHVPADKRAALEGLRRTIRSSFPKAEETISYGIPAFRLDGRVIAWFGSAAKHCSFYPGAALKDFSEELRSYETSKGTIRFKPERPLAAALVRRLVKARIARNAAAVEKKPATRSAARGSKRKTTGRGRKGR